MKKAKIIIIVLVIFLMVIGMSTVGTLMNSANSNGGIPTAEQLEASKSELGDDIRSLKFSVNGDVFQFPMKLQTMLDAGWYLDSSVDVETIPSYSRTLSFAIQKRSGDGYSSAFCRGIVANETAMDLPFKGLNLYELSIEKSSDVTLVLPKGITWNSTFEEVKEAYQPEESNWADTDNSLYMIFTNLENNEHVTLGFDRTTRTLNEVKFH